jgi:hypothetical protein
MVSLSSTATRLGIWAKFYREHDLSGLVKGDEMRRRKLSGHRAIKAAMRRNEVEVLVHIRRNDGAFIWPSVSWYNAMDRLESAGMVVYHNHRYVAKKGARPVTGAVR